MESLFSLLRRACPGGEEKASGILERPDMKTRFSLSSTAHPNDKSSASPEPPQPPDAPTAV